jgi:hypothetical protein
MYFKKNPGPGRLHWQFDFEKEECMNEPKLSGISGVIDMQAMSMILVCNYCQYM